MFDENIDGVLVGFDIGEVRIDSLVGRVGRASREIYDPSSRGDPVNHYAILAEMAPASDIHHAVFAVLSDDRHRSGDHQLPLGLRSYGKLDFGFDYWANAGFSLGNVDGRRLKGYGFAIGGTYRLGDHPLGPRLTLGYAWGSGVRSPDSSTDRTYRQTGLQSNEASLSGLAKFRYYGEALARPAISKLMPRLDGSFPATTCPPRKAASSPVWNSNIRSEIRQPCRLIPHQATDRNQVAMRTRQQKTGRQSQNDLPIMNVRLRRRALIRDRQPFSEPMHSDFWHRSSLDH